MERGDELLAERDRDGDRPRQSAWSDHGDFARRREGRYAADVEPVRAGNGDVA
jgi:hypothetical protein